MKKNLFFFLFIVILSACDKDDNQTQTNNPPPAAAPVACFTVNSNVAFDSTEMFSFTNCSQNAVRYEWDFGDADYAPVANPIHIYNQNGNFIVRMTAYNSDDVPSTVSDTITIGHYSLDKITYQQTSTRFTAPFILRMVRLSYFDIKDTLFLQSSLPLTVQLTDNSIYDITSFVTYTYREDSIPGPISLVQGFTVAASSIINNQFDTALSFGVWDTAKFTLYYKVVGR